MKGGSSGWSNTSTGSEFSGSRAAFEEIPTHDAIIEQIRRTLEANQMHDGVHIRLTLTRGQGHLGDGSPPQPGGADPDRPGRVQPPVYDKSGISLLTSTIRRPTPDSLDPGRFTTAI